MCPYSTLSVRIPAVLTLVLAVACQSGGNTLSESGGIDWIDNPGAISDYLAAAGSSPVASPLSVGVARDAAARNGRNELAATLKTKARTLVEDWAKQAGDLTNKESLSAYVNNEVFARQFVDTELRMARVIEYRQRGDLMYALVVLDNPEKWVQNLGKSLTEQMLRDGTLIKTEVMKNDARERADAFFKKQAEEQRALAERWSKGGKSGK